MKGISGLVLSLIAIPVMASFMDIDRAVAIMIISGVFLNIWLIWTFRKSAVRIKNFPLVCLAGLIGVIWGSLVLSTVTASYLLVFLATWLGVCLLFLFFKKIPAIK